MLKPVVNISGSTITSVCPASGASNAVEVRAVGGRVVPGERLLDERDAKWSQPSSSSA